MRRTATPTHPEITTAVLSADAIDFVAELVRMESNAIGFFPRGALNYHLGAGNCIGAKLRGRHAGFLFGRPSMRYARWCRPITALVVHPAARRNGVARALIDHVATTAVTAGQAALQAWTRDDLVPACRMWDTLGWEMICRRDPGTADKKHMYLWRRQITAVTHPDFHTPPLVAGWKGAKITAVE